MAARGGDPSMLMSLLQGRAGEAGGGGGAAAGGAGGAMQGLGSRDPGIISKLGTGLFSLFWRRQFSI